MTTAKRPLVAHWSEMHAESAEEEFVYVIKANPTCGSTAISTL